MFSNTIERKFLSSPKRREAIWGLAFITPWLIGLVIFTLGPIVAVAYFSFTEYPILQQPEWIALQNYIDIFNDRLFFKVVENTLYYVVIRVPLFLIVAFALALLLNQRNPLMPIFRTLIYLPSMIPIVGLAVMWAVLLNPSAGYVNYALESIGLPTARWLTDPSIIKLVIIVISLWNIGAATIIFLAGLQDIPKSLYEAADIDGASSVQKLKSITLPMMTPTILFNLIIEIINSFQVFAYAFILTGGGPRNGALFYVVYIYKESFENFNMGYASALSMILFIIILAFTLVLMTTSNKWVIYDRT